MNQLQLSAYQLDSVLTWDLACTDTAAELLFFAHQNFAASFDEGGIGTLRCPYRWSSLIYVTSSQLPHPPL